MIVNITSADDLVIPLEEARSSVVSGLLLPGYPGPQHEKLHVIEYWSFPTYQLIVAL